MRKMGLDFCNRCDILIFVVENLERSRAKPQEVPQEVVKAIRTLVGENNNLERVISATNLASELFAAKIEKEKDSGLSTKG